MRKMPMVTGAAMAAMGTLAFAKFPLGRTSPVVVVVAEMALLGTVVLRMLVLRMLVLRMLEVSDAEAVMVIIRTAVALSASRCRC